jgi:SAM-dependent methyltransferase
MTEAEKQVAWLTGWLAEHPDAGLVYGEQWGKVTDGAMAGVFAHLCDCLALSPGCVVEIGPGGGRWSREIAPRIPEASRLILVDGTDAARDTLARQVRRPFDLIVSPDGKLQDVPAKSVDLVFSFDVFVHFDEGLLAGYLAEIARILKPGGRLMLHYARPWPGHPGVMADPTGCFRPIAPGCLAFLAEHFERDDAGAYLPIPRGFGSLFVSVTRR